ncbi:MAG TPA: D-alanine--D-alanine ligase [Chloroflexi bacterium]|nr:D-alanine--D-alanine ligase [Chloroflexota bacterium]
MSQKIHLVVLFGGRSGEHEVSLMSARSVLEALKPERYEIIPVGVTKEGRWLASPDALEAFTSGRLEGLTPVTLLPDPSRPGLWQWEGEVLKPYAPVDVVFPVLHGTFGEDGTLQGLLELADVAYVGAGVVGSAVGMDKGVFKDVMRAHGLPLAEYVVLSRREVEEDAEAAADRCEALAPYPLFVKPANLGSSVGITKAHNRAELLAGLRLAARYDRRLVVERGLDAREIEVAVLGNAEPRASLPGEVVPGEEFYSYEAKYEDETSQLFIPAPLSAGQTARVRELAVAVYQAIDCAGMARVDFLLERTSGVFYINEVNTLPGFTQISMYPKLWEATGLPYSDLLDELVALAQERKRERDRTRWER